MVSVLCLFSAVRLGPVVCSPDLSNLWEWLHTVAGKLHAQLAYSAVPKRNPLHHTLRTKSAVSIATIVIVCKHNKKCVTTSHQDLTVNAIATKHRNLWAMFQHEIVKNRWLRYASFLPHVMVNVDCPKVLVMEIK